MTFERGISKGGWPRPNGYLVNADKPKADPQDTRPVVTITGQLTASDEPTMGVSGETESDCEHWYSSPGCAFEAVGDTVGSVASGVGSVASGAVDAVGGVFKVVSWAPYIIVGVLVVVSVFLFSSNAPRIVETVSRGRK